MNSQIKCEIFEAYWAGSQYNFSDAFYIFTYVLYIDVYVKQKKNCIQKVFIRIFYLKENTKK